MRRVTGDYSRDKVSNSRIGNTMSIVCSFANCQMFLNFDKIDRVHNVSSITTTLFFKNKPRPLQTLHQMEIPIRYRSLAVIDK